MKKQIFDSFLAFLSKITSKKVTYISNDYINAGNLAVKSKYGFWYCGNVFDQTDIAYGIASNGDVESFDSSLVKDILMSFKDKYIFYDIGANTGWYSMLAALLNKRSSVYSFEPVTEHVDCLKESITLNRFDDRVIIHPVALSNTNGEASILLAGSGSSLEKEFLPVNEGVRIIQTKTLDSLVKMYNIPFPDFIKIDVEGHEYKVLLGAKEVLSKSTPILFIEIAKTLKNIHRNFVHKDYEAIFSLLFSLGYEPFIVKNDTLEKFDLSANEDGVRMFLFLNKEKHSKLIKSL